MVVALAAGGDVEEKVTRLREQIAQLGGGTGARGRGQEPEPDGNGAELRGPLGELLTGGLPRGAVTECADSSTLLAELLAEATAAGLSAGLVGAPGLALAAVEERGGDLSRLVAVPEPGTAGLRVVAALLEGLDVVVYRAPAERPAAPRGATRPTPNRLPAAQERSLKAKLARGRAALVIVGASVSSPALRLRGQIAALHGIGRGTGRIAGVTLKVAAARRGAPDLRGEVLLGRGPEAESRAARRGLKAVG